MIQRVYERAQQSAAQRVVVATDDARVADAVRKFGGEVCMTSDRHESGTDRIQETAQLLGLGADQLVVNVQGDEPLIPARVIDQVAANLALHTAADIATLCAPIDSHTQFVDPNCVKVVADKDGYALYFSRAPIPFPRDQQAGELPAMGARRHLGIYAYRVSFLHRFITWPVSALEATEKLEQLRAMEHGVRIHVAPASVVPPAGVDTAEDLEIVRRLVNQG
jgi:3-deoxy-manno-octulosonate cytidylyltransferase (CMP-KDO synthetase)